MTRLLKHYSDHVWIVASKVLITALRCASCQDDFHIDKEPRYCPNCGTEVSCIIPFGTAVPK
jgi:rRNA maturation endonuclease Nob1